MSRAGVRKGGVLGIAVAFCALSITSSLGATGAAERGQKTHARISPADRVTQKAHENAAEPAPEPAYRAHFGHADLYIPTFFRAAAGSYDVIVHFHGMHDAQDTNIERAKVNAVVVSVNLGMGSGPYEDAFRDPASFTRILNAVDRHVDKSGRAPGARMGRVALSAWSAGYGAVSALLRDPATVQRIDAVLLADGLHSGYSDEKKRVVNEAPLGKYAKIAEAAFKGDKLFVLTHSSIPTYGYPSASETIGTLLKITSTPKTVNATVGPRSMRQIYESHRGDFHVKGFEGQGVKDHIDHIWGMNETILPYLRERWSGAVKEP